MIAPIKRRPVKSAAPWHRGFLAMLPTIRAYARGAFARLNPDLRQDLTQEVIANCLVAYVRLWQQGRVALAYPTVLAKYGIAQVCDHRRVGAKLNVRDVLSKYCQDRKGVIVERLDHFDEEDNAWAEVVVEDRNVGPAEVAATRMDFAAWLRVLPGRLRKIARVLATGETTTAAAKRFHVSAGRVSQIRMELKQAWERFQGEQPSPAAA
jgi:hypothetical protein